MGARILHVSDLHVGAHEDPAVEQALHAFAEREQPELVVASGDLTHRARRAQHERVAQVLRDLGFPLLAVPGNHDIPWAPSRLTRPFAEFDRMWPTREPVYSSSTLHVVGINSVRPWRQQSGGVGASGLARAVERLAQAEPGALRVAVLHHQLIGAPWRTHKKTLARRGDVLRTLAGAGAELIVGGHVHQSAVAERREFEVVEDGSQHVVVAIAPGIGRPRPGRAGEARGLHVYELDDAALAVRTYVWCAGGWVQTGERRYRRGPVSPRP